LEEGKPAGGNHKQWLPAMLKQHHACCITCCITLYTRYTEWGLGTI